MKNEEIQFIMQIASDSGISVTESRATEIWLAVKDEICHNIIHLVKMIKGQLAIN
jgi:hypothetical protein